MIPPDVSKKTHNANPNNPEQVPPGPLFTNAARVGVARWFGGWDLRTAEWVTQQLSEIQYTDEDRYVRMHASDTEGTFNGAYAGELKDLNQIILEGEASGTPGSYAPALALRTWGYAYLTNSWRDIPYFQAREDISDQVKRKVLYDNAVRYYGLKD